MVVTISMYTMHEVLIEDVLRVQGATTGKAFMKCEDRILYCDWNYFSVSVVTICYAIIHNCINEPSGIFILVRPKWLKLKNTLIEHTLQKLLQKQYASQLHCTNWNYKQFACNTVELCSCHLSAL